MTQKTYSQKVACGLEILDYLLLVPAIPALLYAVFLLLMSPLFGLAIYAFAAYGFYLMSRYFKHSRGRLSARGVSGMWIGTIVYNAILLSFVVYSAPQMLANNLNDNVYFNALKVFVPISAYVMIIGFALVAILSDRNQKYR